MPIATSFFRISRLLISASNTWKTTEPPSNIMSYSATTIVTSDDDNDDGRIGNKDDYYNENPKQTVTPHDASQQQQSQQRMKPSISLWDFLDPNKPWILVSGGSFMDFFDFVPLHYRHGPWSLSALWGFPTLLYILAFGFIWVDGQKPRNGWYATFSSSSSLQYEPYTEEWYYTLGAFCWMVFICWNTWTKSPIGKAAWISFTLWSWTINTVRHGLCVLAPFVKEESFGSRLVPLVKEILRFPCLLSASMTFGVWNFLLFPAILFVFIKNAKQRRTFFGYFTNFRLTQLHFFNIWFAVSNTVLVPPLRPLHYGDLIMAAIMMIVYMFWYYMVLDRIGIHLYPIFTPRSALVPLSWVLIVVLCLGGYHFWKNVIDALLVAGSVDGGENKSGLIRNLGHLMAYFRN